ncbi:MAG: hypothetical protein COW01_14390 [Bdellovibrionales bacterium CG12_big_fil_rev_8_21_14_0_65_38_15]|nr:MAG: hypothetical protein COW79_13860 [Bdellovibrionales bacterium CG22_combo_CG10-13_8_21_14_all_38_13]PIQ53219.1 MAG: hypothetical protein COW01_14390 [Bdellovibrionales bacterium CG12_big_fil_rev_8_21_14_0_65_38_15]PIR29148.1 MAG: hypothetical protein COV38_11860 [Bdellovibrionales bacterium CG11_big_fil_rev_8_21_14_0_20_38_13]
MAEQDIIIGLHSIAEALKNPNRTHYRLIGTDEGMKELQRKHGLDPRRQDDLRAEFYKPDEFVKQTQELYRHLGVEYRRIPSGVMLLTSPYEIQNVNWLYDRCDKPGRLKLLILDQITDGHNAAAILRTASFFGCDAIVFAQKGSFGVTPSFSRIASGALEHVPLVQVVSLPKTLTQLAQKNISLVGFSEHAESAASNDGEEKIALVLGAEETGLSHAVERLLTRRVALHSFGAIKSLNVSVAAAIAMERCFPKE